MFKSISGRSLAFATVLLVLAITLAPPLQRFFAQNAQINAYKVQIASAQATLNEAKRELTLWADPSYVESQARVRLHYVFPGERQYIVLGAGAQATGSSQPAAQVATQIPAGLPWYNEVIASITAANSNS